MTKFITVTSIPTNHDYQLYSFVVGHVAEYKWLRWKSGDVSVTRYMQDAVPINRKRIPPLSFF
jgi:hypothetical protein